MINDFVFCTEIENVLCRIFQNVFLPVEITFFFFSSPVIKKNMSVNSMSDLNSICFRRGFLISDKNKKW